MRLKGWIVLVGLLLFAGIFSDEAYAANRQETYHVTNLPVSDGEHILLRTTHPIELEKKATDEYPNVQETTYTYSIKRFNAKAGELEIVKRQFNNGDYFLFSKVDNNKLFDFYMEIEWALPEGTETNLVPFSTFPKPTGTSTTMGEDPTSYPTGLLEITKDGQHVKQVMVGKAYRSRELIKRYENVNKSVVRELFSESDALTIEEKNTEKQMIVSLQSSGKDIVEQWLMVSDEQLFKNKEELTNWMKYSAANYRKTNKWYTADGPYNKMVLTVEPQPLSKMGYGRTLLTFREAEALERYKRTNERYYYNLALNSVADLLNFRGERKFWETEVTSTYLTSLYNITAPFIDTRFNEYIALYLRDMGKELQLDALTEPLLTYADFLLEQIETDNVIRINEKGALIPDYFAVFDPILTHTSLNHGLGGMNLLLEAYLATKDEKYLEGAQVVQEGINGLGKQWLREDGDTWYKVNPDLTFVGRDYELLTVEDLLKSYRLWSEIDQSQLEMIETFLVSKTSYLKAAGFTIPSDIQNELYSYGIGI
ncbi:hypothetical protein [Cytobacillus massiliigabonensis]|uniref:hypothetical protein n=1 Tax=Cytobacillus massiliigabonensis TaxID=1871011 RepID=UPI000C82A9A2|nr:hypothetical protein [Cytobacillus massiliigabonensis]